MRYTLFHQSYQSNNLSTSWQQRIQHSMCIRCKHRMYLPAKPLGFCAGELRIPNWSVVIANLMNHLLEQWPWISADVSCALQAITSLVIIQIMCYTPQESWINYIVFYGYFGSEGIALVLNTKYEIRREAANLLNERLCMIFFTSKIVVVLLGLQWTSKIKPVKKSLGHTMVN